MKVLFFKFNPPIQIGITSGPIYEPITMHSADVGNDSSANDVLWHNLDIEQVFDKLSTSHNGLSNDECQTRLDQYGSNELEGKKKRHPVLKMIDHFRDPMVYLLMAAAIIAFIADKEDKGTPIFIVLALSQNAIF